MKKTKTNNKNDSRSVRRVPFVPRLAGAILALLMLPYGTVTAGQTAAQTASCEPISAGNAANVCEERTSSSCVLLQRFGITTDAASAEAIEEGLLRGEDPLEIVREILPDAVAAGAGESREIKMLELINQIPLGARSELFKDLAGGTPWEEIAPEILSQIPLPLAAEINHENAGSAVCGLPVPILIEEDMSPENNFPCGPPPTPYSESPVDQQALPASTVLSAGMMTSLRPGGDALAAAGIPTDCPAAVAPPRNDVGGSPESLILLSAPLRGPPLGANIHEILPKTARQTCLARAISSHVSMKTSSRGVPKAFGTTKQSRWSSSSRVPACFKPGLGDLAGISVFPSLKIAPSPLAGEGWDGGADHDIPPSSILPHKGGGRVFSTNASLQEGPGDLAGLRSSRTDIAAARRKSRRRIASILVFNCGPIQSMGCGAAISSDKKDKKETVS